MAFRLLDLPAPAFQCVIEHMVKTVGLYKAQRLRLICSESASLECEPTNLSVDVEELNSEVLRAVFATNIFDLRKFRRTKSISPECFYIHLRAKINNPQLHSRDILSTAIRQAVQYLLSNGQISESNARQAEVTDSMCFCIAYNFDLEYWYDARPFDVLSKLSDHNFVPPTDALAITAALGNKTLLQESLNKGFDPDARSPVFGYPLQNAATLGHRETAKLILEQSSRNGDGASSCDALFAGLISAARMGQTAIALDILSVVPKPFQETLQLQQAICTAARHGHTELLGLLLDLDISSKPQLLAAALQSASMRGWTETMKYLLDNGADPNLDLACGGCLSAAARFGNTYAVQLLLERGAKYWNGINSNPLKAAATRGHKEIAAILLKNGASLDRSGSRDSAYCVSIAKNGEVSMLRFLIKHGLNLLKFGDRALQMAAEYGEEDMVRFMVSQGVSVNGKGSGWPPMLRALMWSQNHIVDTLLELGATPVDPLQSDFAEAFRAGEYPANKDI